MTCYYILHIKFQRKQKHFNDWVHFGIVVAAAMECIDMERRREAEKKRVAAYVHINLCIDRVYRKILMPLEQKAFGPSMLL